VERIDCALGAAISPPIARTIVAPSGHWPKCQLSQRGSGQVVEAALDRSKKSDAQLSCVHFAGHRGDVQSIAMEFGIDPDGSRDAAG